MSDGYESPDCNELAKNYNEGEHLLKRVVMLEEIGSGSFGKVYLAKYRSGGYVAAKIDNDKKSSKIPREINIYYKLLKRGCRGYIPKIYDHIDSNGRGIILMQLMGPSLDDMFEKCSNKFSLETTLELADQIITIMEKMHKARYIHRDIKPNNFMIGRGKNKNRVYILDFGLSKSYISRQGEHIPVCEGRSLIGTARYASVNMHMGIEPTRRDDMESIGYMLIYFMKGRLPWQGLKRTKEMSHLKRIGEVKICTNIDIMCDGLPPCFKEYVYYCRNLGFDQEPDYDHMRYLFKKSAEQWNTQPNLSQFKIVEKQKSEL